MSFNGLVSTDFVRRARLDDRVKEGLIDFTASDFLTLRSTLINYIKSAYPLDYNYFVESDLGMMLIELVASMGHIMSYKADFLANENFLRTAQKRSSVQKLLELIGVRIQGPTSAAANGRITLEQPRSSGVTIRVPIQSRTFTVTSPEDSTQLSYTMYKYNPNGFVEFDSEIGDIDFEYSNQTSSVINNIILLEGNLVRQTGTFIDTDAVKTITLTESPIIEGSIQVSILSELSATAGDYRKLENIFFTSGPSDKAYQVIYDDNFAGTILFGDGTLGQPPAPNDQYVVYYRVGGGSRGNIAKGALNAPVPYFELIDGSPVGSQKQGIVENTSMGTGGTNAQTIANAKRYAPLVFKSQDRLVTTNDFIAFVNTFRSTYGSVGKATVATRKAFSSANIIDIYVLEKANDTQMKRATPEFKKQLLEAMEPKKMITDEIVVVDGLIRTIDPIIKVLCDKKYKIRENEIKLRVRDKVIEFFNIDNAEFGKSFNTVELNSKIFEVLEVRYSTLENLPSTIHTQFNEVIQLNNLTILVVFE